MKNNISFVKINKDNLKIACRIQNEIFSVEDGSMNYIE